MMAYQKVYMNQIHSSSLLSQLAEMWRRDVLCDAVITTGTVDTKAHRLVLVAACPMLQSMDSASVGNKLEVKLSADISKEAVVSFLQYLYDGFMTLTEDNVRDIEKIARLLQVDSVTKCCNNFYKDLYEKVGQTVGSNAMYCFNADSLDLKHIRTSHLQRLMQNNIEKRVLETEQVSGRKRAKIQKNTIGPDQKSTQEDSFHLIQSQQKDTRQMSQDKPVLQHSLALSVAGKTESSSLDNQVIVADDSDSATCFEQPSSQSDTVSQRIFATSGASLNSSEYRTNSINPEKKSSVSKTFDKTFAPSANTPSACKEKFANLPLQKSDWNSKLHKHKSTAAKKSNLKSQTESQDKKQDPFHGGLVPKLVGNNIIIEQMTEEYNRLDTMESVKSTPSSLENGAHHSERKGITSEIVDSIDTDNVTRSSPDLSRIKIEPESINVSCGMPSQEEGHSQLEDNDEEASDTEGVQLGHTNQSSFMAEEHGSSWYTQTFKDVLDNEWNTSYNPSDQKLLHLDHHKVNDHNGQRYLLPGKTAAVPIQQKLIRALATLKSPVVFLRNLQRKLSGGVKIDRLKEFLIQNKESPDFEMLPLEEIDGALFRFYRSTVISPVRLRNFPRQISEHLGSQPYSRSVNIETDWRFEASNNAINAGLVKHFQDDSRRKKAMKQEDLNKLYESGVLSNDNPVSLQNKVWVELMIYIGGLARTDLRRLEKDNFVFEKDSDGRLYYRLEAHCMTEAKKHIRVYEQPDNLNCPLRSICLYLSKLHPKSDVFFVQPVKPFAGDSDSPVWYTTKPIGKNIHSMWLATICKEAGITTEYSNHALYCRPPQY